MRNHLAGITIHGVMLAVALGLGAGIGAYLGRTTPVQAEASAATVLRASKFELVDRTGHVQASLHLSAQGEPLLFMFGRDGKVRLSLAVINNEPGLDLADGQGVHRFSLAAESNGASMSFADGDEQPRLLLECGDAQGPAISLVDPDQKPRLQLTCPEKSGPGIALRDTRDQIIFRVPAGPGPLTSRY